MAVDGSRRVFLREASTALCALSLAEAAPQQAERREYDVLVWDSTPAGIATAIAASRAGLRTAIVTEDKHVGGMQTSGLGNTNTGQRETVGGLAREFHRRIHEYYTNLYGADSANVQACQGGFHFEPHVAERVYLEWMRGAGVTCLSGEWIESVEKNGPRLVAVRTGRGNRIGARIFVDASYEGDLLKLAGCSYHLGREAASKYGESLAGVRFPPERVGQADRKLQPFDYRLCLTDVADNRVPFVEPANYNPSDYFFQGARFKHAPPARLHQALPLNPMPNRKTDSRTGEWVGASWDYPEAGPAERQRIEKAHRNYSAGYVWFLLQDAPLPAPLRDELSRWGLAKDEFTDNDNWPYHIYVREGRRLVGDFVITQHDVTERRFFEDGVALGNFYLDVHPVDMVVTHDMVVAEGWLGNVRVKPYEIPYRSLVPKRSDAVNLLVPVCLSASHIAFSTIRMEPVWMMLGHACGIAASLALESGASVQDVDGRLLRKRLAGEGQIVDARPFNREWPFR